MSISHPNLFKRSNGIWYVVYQDEGRIRWKSTGKQLKHEALEMVSEFDQHRKGRPTGILFSEFTAEFLKLQSISLRETTIKRIYIPAFKSFLAVCGDRRISSYNVKDVERFKSQRMLSCTATKVNIEFRTLKAAFNLANKWGSRSKILLPNPRSSEYLNGSPYTSRRMNSENSCDSSMRPN